MTTGQEYGDRPQLVAVMAAHSLVHECRQYRRVFKNGMWRSELRQNKPLEHVLAYLDARANVLRGGFYTKYRGTIAA